MIPKKIHYCWFGGNPLPEFANECISSWKEFFPDFEIVRWDETNFDIHCCAYIEQAYAAQKWAFVSDYARFKILYEHGGIYFDTDVQIIKPFDHVIANGGFMGCEKNTPIAVAPGLGLGAEPGCTVFHDLMLEYHDRAFLNEDGTMNQETVVQYTTEYLRRKGLKNSKDLQRIEDILIYPQTYFCPMDYNSGKVTITEKTLSIHHYSATWHDEKEKYALDLRRMFVKWMPNKVASILGTAISIVRYEGFMSCFRWVLKSFR